MNLISKRISTFLFALVVLITAGCKGGGDQSPKVESLLTINSEISPLRAYDSSWENGDEIGVYAFTAGANLSETSLNPGSANVKFITNGSGAFRSSGRTIRIEQSKNLDVIAYYPYSENVGADFKIALDVSDQSNPSALDLLYAKSNAPVNVLNPQASLTFDHKLSQLVVTLVTPEGTVLMDTRVTLDGSVVKGTFDISTGELSLGSFKSALSAKKLSENGGSASFSYLLLPGQSMEGKTFTFTFNGRRYSHVITADQSVMMQGGYRYTYPFTVTSTGEVKLILDGAIIDKIEDGGEDDVIGEKESDLEVDPSEVHFPASAEAGGPSLSEILQVKTKDDEVWTAVADAEFLSLFQSTTEGPGTLTITALENDTYVERTAKVTITAVSKNATPGNEQKRVKVITVKQAAKTKPDDPTVERTHYMEIPAVNSGNMEDGYYVMHTAPDSYFKGGHTQGGIRRNFTIYYSKNSTLPYWVAYPLYPDCMGSSGRTDEWGWDPIIPREYQPDLSSAYKGSPKQSRGHMLASSARTASRNLNVTTFYYTNMIPQVQSHNAGNWAQLENLEKSWGNKNDYDTIYVATGPIFDPNTTHTVSDKNGVKKVPIPTHSWKVMLRYDRSKQKYYSLAAKIPNLGDKTKWYDHVTTVAELEKELGVTFFTHLPAEVANEVKNQKDPSKW